MSESLWAITAYFNPMHWRRRAGNFRRFRQRLRIPLVAVELGYDGRFDLEPGDADILLQFPAADVMWQKERLFNLALAAVPAEVDAVAAVDGDIVFHDSDVWAKTRRALDRDPIVQCFSHVHYLPADFPSDVGLIESTLPASPGFGWLRGQGQSTLDLCNPAWRNPNDLPPVSYGLAWAFRRELFAERGFYDAWVIGGGTRVHCFASEGLWRECADAMRFTPAMREHFQPWAEGFAAAVRGRWGCVPGPLSHLWHGSMGSKQFRQRYVDFSRFDFDPHSDLTADKHGAWQWASDKPAMHDYVRSYFASRREDGEAAIEPLTAAPASAS